MLIEKKTRFPLVLRSDLDVGLKEYYTDSNGTTVENPRFLIKGEKVIKHSGRRVSRKIKGSKNRGKARQILGKRHLKISRQPHCTMQ
jgi:putative transposase